MSQRIRQPSFSGPSSAQKHGVTPSALTLRSNAFPRTLPSAVITPVAAWPTARFEISRWRLGQCSIQRFRLPNFQFSYWLPTARAIVGYRLLATVPGSTSSDLTDSTMQASISLHPVA